MPLEAESVALEGRSVAALEFPDQTRLVIAPLLTSGLPSAFRQKYEFILVSETRVRLGRWDLPSGMVGIALEPENLDAPTRMLIARDFSGNEIERVALSLATGGKAARLSLVLKGEIVWSVPEKGVGVCFHDLAPGTVALINDSLEDIVLVDVQRGPPKGARSRVA